MPRLTSNAIRRIAVALCLSLLAAPAAQAGKLYRWTDRNGVSHYGDKPPDAQARSRSVGEVATIPFRSEPTAVARVRIQQSGESYLAWIDNQLAGPLDVVLDYAENNDFVSKPSLPAQAVLPARASAVVAELRADPSIGGSFALRVSRATPGDPRARPRSVTYQLPLKQSQFRIDQGYGGHFSHTGDEHYYAIDFAAEIGTPVLAARAGVVMQVESDFDQAGLNLEKFGDRANYIRILHDDGTMALYAHLKPDGGVQVRAGQHVQAGQQIGSSGNTGFSTGPHLHFVVQVNRNGQLVSIPVRMTGPQGPLNLSGGR